MISNSGHDENGKYNGGAAGDQTGGEWALIPWYSRPWNYVLRHPNPNVRETLAQLSEEAAKNNNIGYDQDQRTTYWKQLQNSGYRPKNITVKCEADCSAGVAANVKATGYLLGIDSLKNVSKDCYTGNLRSALKNAGFLVLTDSKYLTSDKYLLRGDVLLYEYHHTAVNVTNGTLSGASVTPNSSTTSDTELKFGSTGSEVKELQTNLNKLGYDCGTPDGSFGTKTDTAVRNFQKNNGLSVDGQVGSKTKEKIEQCLKVLSTSSQQTFKSYYVKNGKKGMLVTANLNYRTRPVDGEVKGLLIKGNYVFPTERTAGGAFPNYWFKVNGYWCSGKYLKGWVLDKTANKWWYNNAGSYPQSEWLQIDNVWYYFKSDGYMATNAYVKAKDKNVWYYVDANGSWTTSKDVTTKPSNVVK